MTATTLRRLLAALAALPLLLPPLSVAAYPPPTATVNDLLAICAEGDGGFSDDDPCVKVFLDWDLFEVLDYQGCAYDGLSPEIAYAIYDWLNARPELKDQDVGTAVLDAASDLWHLC